MSKKIISLIVLIFACIIVAVSYITMYNTTQSTKGNQPQTSPPENPEEPSLVVPESPVGTLGLISALVVGFGVFTILKKRRLKP